MLQKEKKVPDFKISDLEKKIWKIFAVWFGSGLAPKAPGTFGTLAALPFAWAIQYCFGHLGLFVASVIIFFVGIKAANEYIKHYSRKHDPKEIVIDEVAGVWLLLSFPVIPFSWQGYAIAFILFRLFDVLKPWPISLADRKVKGGFGVMLDDILAAVYPYIIICVILAFVMRDQ